MRARSVAIFAICGSIAFASAEVALGEVYKLQEPPNSPYWWTLTDDLSPQDLRRIHRDRRGHIERFQAATAAGLEQPLGIEALEGLSVYYNALQSPELTPMWEALDVFAGDHLEIDGAEFVTEAMTRHGISATGRELIVEMSKLYILERDGSIGEVRDDTQAFVELQKKVSASHGKGRLKSALANADHQFFAREGGIPESRARQLFEAWKTDPISNTAVGTLTALRDQLTTEDWQGLRRYLLQDIVSQMGPVIDFD